MKRFGVAVLLAAMGTVCHAAVPLREKTYSYGDDAALAPLDATFHRALADNGWVLMESAPGHVVAKTVVRFKHFATIDLSYGSGQARIRLVQSKNLEQEPCIYSERNKTFRGPCVHAVYYDWLEKLMQSLPAAHERVQAALAAPEPAPSAGDPVVPAAGVPVNELVYAALLTGASDDVVLAGRALQAWRTQPLTDLAAQVLTEACDGKTAHGDEAQSWLAKGVAVGGTVRYRAVVEKCLAATENPKIQKYFQMALEAMTAPAETFVPGSVDVAAERASVRAAVEAGRRTPKPEDFYALPFGIPAQEAVERLGMPADLGNGRKRSRVGGGPIRIRIQSSALTFEYDDIGALVFERPSDTDRNWVLIGAEYEPALELLPPAHRALAVRQQLSGFDASSARARVEVIRRAELRDIESLDVVAQLISERRNEDNGLVVNALAHLCRILGNSGRSRYRPLLEDLARNAKTSALRRHADNSVKQLKPSEDPPFVPQPLAAAR